LANAKLNLFFKVGNKRSDGYHEIQSLIVFLRLADNVTLTLANQEGVEGGGMHLYGINSNNIPKDAQNLVAKAINLLRDNYQSILPKYHVSLAKTIPSGAGLGGGSADAAAVLKLLAGRHEEVQPMVGSYPWHQNWGLMYRFVLAIGHPW
jgi:4-diphosphocytidyl-2-C-methyl-D-erythritol kinase